MERKIKILVCAFACLQDPDRRFGHGGEGILGWNIVKQLARFHKIWVLTSAQNRAGIEAELQHKPSPNIWFHYFDLPRWLQALLRFPGGIQLYAYLWQIKAYFVARRLHKQICFDVFHHVTYANDWMASFIGALLPIPYIRGPGGGAHKTPKTFLKVYPFRLRMWERLRSLAQWLFRHDPFSILGQRRTKAILICNREALEVIPPRWRHKAHLFPVNGISSEDLTLLNNHSPTKKDRFLVLSAGKLLRLKGFSLAIRAFKSFSESHPKAALEIVGDGPDRPYLEALIQKLRLQGRARLHPWMPRTELLKKMLSSDVFLFPSLRDGGGAVVVEAMASGKPVICLDIGGPGFHIMEEWGIKVAPHSPEQAISEMAEALEHLYKDRELHCRLGKAAHKRAVEVYHWDRLGERLMEIYEEALGFQPVIREKAKGNTENYSPKYGDY